MVSEIKGNGGGGMPGGRKVYKKDLDKEELEELNNKYPIHRGQWRIYEDAEEDVEIFRERVNSYFAKCKAQGMAPNTAGLMVELGVSPYAYEKYRHRPGYEDILATVSLMLEDFYVQKVLQKESARGAEFILAAKFGFAPETRKTEEREIRVVYELPKPAAAELPSGQHAEVLPEGRVITPVFEGEKNG